MRKNCITPNKHSLNLIYKSDVIIRRMVLEVLKPIELEIQTHLIYLLEEKEISIQNVMNGEIFESLDDIHKSLYKNKINTITFVISKFNKYIKRGVNQLSKIILKMTFGEIAALISILKNEYVSLLFENQNKSKINEILDNVVHLRNHIAHHNILFAVEKLRINNKNVEIKEVIKQLINLANGNYESELISKINTYRDNVIKKHYSEDEELKNIVINIFDKFIIHLVSV